MSAEEDFMKAYKLWKGFKEEVLYNNRFIIKHEVLNYLKQIADKSQKKLGQGTILFRARIYDGDLDFLNYLEDGCKTKKLDKLEQLKIKFYQSIAATRQETGFWGFDSEGSFVPPINDHINDGRANPAFIKYLYTSEDSYTALVEVRPYLKDTVSIAEIKVNESLKIADFSTESFGQFDGFEQIFIYLIMRDFSVPSNSNQKHYIPTQYVAEYVKSLGFEGIKFNSSLDGKGRNITIFNYDKCEPIGSKVYEVKDICFETKCIAPKDEKELIHWKLEPHKEKMQKLSNLYDINKIFNAWEKK